MTRDEAIKLLQATRLMLMDGANQPISDLYYALDMAIEALQKADRKTEPTTQTETQNSNLTFEKDECAKEYEELGLKELKELIEADRKTEPNSSEKPNNCDDCIWSVCNYNKAFETEPTRSKMEQVEDEPQEDVPILTAEEWAKIKKTMPESRLILFDDDGIAFEPQTVERAKAEAVAMLLKSKDESQTNCPWK